MDFGLLYELQVLKPPREGAGTRVEATYQRRLHAMERHVLGEYQIIGAEVRFRCDTLSHTAQQKSRW